MSTLAILFADICGSTRLYQELGDVHAHQKITSTLRGLQAIVEQAEGTLLRTVGDAILASFPNCESALMASTIIHQEKTLLAVRIGYHWGEVISDDGDLYGDAVNIAARVSSIAQTGETTITLQAKEQLNTNSQNLLTLLDHISFKGIEEPVAVFRTAKKLADLNTTHIFNYDHRNKDIRREKACELRLQSGGRTLSLSKHKQVINLGRESNNDLIITALGTSKVHANIECKRGRFVLTDTSSNGTFVAKYNEPYVFLHRDRMTLDGQGKLYLGRPPSSNSNTSYIEFSTHLL